MSLFLLINILSAGVVLASSVIIIIFGSKTLSTRFFGLFWFILFLYSFILIIHKVYNIPIIKYLEVLHYFIPSFFCLFALIRWKEKFKFYYLSSFLIPVIFIALNIIIKINHTFLNSFYHFLFWIFCAWMIMFIHKDKKSLNKKTKKLYGILLIIISIMPFLILNLILSVILKKPISFEEILPPSFAAASILGMYYIYKKQLVIFDYEYYASIDFLKKSSTHEKKTLVEKLTAGLIHEIKNPITALSSLNQQLLEKIEKMNKDDIKKYLRVTHDDIERIKKLVNDHLKIIKRADNSKKEEINLFNFLISIKDFIDFELKKKNINFTISGELKNLTVKYYKDKLKQIFLNLIYNSIESNAKNIFIFKNGKEFFIEDDGEGVNKNQKDLIFKPFFTTKLDGIGIGLSIIKDILNENFGNIELAESRKGKTVFKITL